MRCRQSRHVTRKRTGPYPGLGFVEVPAAIGVTRAQLRAQPAIDQRQLTIHTRSNTGVVCHHHKCGVQ